MARFASWGIFGNFGFWSAVLWARKEAADRNIVLDCHDLRSWAPSASAYKIIKFVPEDLPFWTNVSCTRSRPPVLEIQTLTQNVEIRHKTAMNVGRKCLVASTSKFENLPGGRNRSGHKGRSAEEYSSAFHTTYSTPDIHRVTAA